MTTFDLTYLKVPRKNTIQGLAFPMRLDGVGGYLTSNENLGTLRDGVIQLLMTARGSRVMRPDFGTDLRKSAFEIIDDTLLNTLRSQILEVIAKYEPRVIVQAVDVIPDAERSELKVRLKLASKSDLLNPEMVEVTV